MAKSLGFKPISLGAIRLRTETAAFFVATAIRLANM
jgi:16S rRNA U1498 N3-methylase RsmE